MLTLTTAYVNKTSDARLVGAQLGFLRGCLRFNIMPVIYADPMESILGGRPKFGDVLRLARRCSASNWMLWCNSDCELTDDPHRYLANPEYCYGFHRIETADGRECQGVDMYAIPLHLWDEYLSKDIPDMYVGATMIDWWITRACQKVNRYAKGPSILHHPSHTAGNVSAGNLNIHNEVTFRAWAARNGVDQR